MGGRLHGWPQSQRGAAASVPRQRAAPPSPWNGKQLPDSPGDGPARPCSPGGNQLPGLVLSRETQQPGQDGGGPSSVWAGRTQPTRGARQCSSGFASAGRPALRSPAPWASRRHPQGRSWGIAAPAAQLVLEGRVATPWRLPGAQKLNAPPLKVRRCPGDGEEHGAINTQSLSQSHWGDPNPGLWPEPLEPNDVSGSRRATPCSGKWGDLLGSGILMLWGKSQGGWDSEGPHLPWGHGAEGSVGGVVWGSLCHGALGLRGLWEGYCGELSATWCLHWRGKH